MVQQQRALITTERKDAEHVGAVGLQLSRSSGLFVNQPHQQSSK